MEGMAFADDGRAGNRMGTNLQETRDLQRGLLQVRPHAIPATFGRRLASPAAPRPRCDSAHLPGLCVSVVQMKNTAKQVTRLPQPMRKGAGMVLRSRR
jgi:hypothetical protein